MADIRIVPAQGAINVTGSADFKGTGGSTILYLTGSGQIGAGTTAPDSEFHIVGSGTRFVTLDRSGTRSYDLGVNSSGTFLVTDNTATADRIALNHSGSVGIGTTNPLSRLHISSEDAGLRVVGTTRSQIFLSNSTAAWQIESPTSTGNVPAGALGIVESGAGTRLSILTGGSVGIGTTNPVQALHVVGNIYQRTGDVITWSNGDAQIGAVSGYNLAFSTYDGSSAMVEHLRITSGGNVGIGTTSAASKLTVYKAAGNSMFQLINASEVGFSMKIHNSGSNNTGDKTFMQYLDYNGNVNGYIAFNRGSSAANGFISFGDNGGERVRFDNGGNVGIGTTTPSQKLAVFGSALITGSLTIGATSIGANENTLVLGPPPAGGSGEGGQLLLQAPGGTYTSASMWDNYQNQTRLLRGSNAGSDAIIAAFNMHSKQMQLPAYNSTSAFSGTVAGLLAFDSSGNILTTPNSAGGTVNSGTAGYIAYYPSSGTTIDDTSGLYWDSTNSRVGISTSSPAYKLDVTGDIRATGAIYANANGAMYFQGGDDAALYDINLANHLGVYGVQDSTIASIKLGSGGGVISGKGGNIGIGTTNPAYKLEVNGTSYFADTIYNGGGYISWTTGYGDGTTQTYNANSLAFLSNASSYAARMFISSGGNIGIGTTNPNSTFQVSKGGVTFQVTDTNKTASNSFSVYGYSQTSWAIATGNSGSFSGGEKIIITDSGNIGIGTTNPTAKLFIEGNDIVLNTEGSTQGKSLYFRYSDGGTVQSDSYLRFNTGGSPTEKVRILADGNVGIGTTGPIGKLQIAGTSGNLLTVGTLTNNWGGDVAIGITNGNGVILSKINTANDTNRVLVFSRDDTNGATITGYTPTGGSTDIGFLIRANSTSYLNGGSVGIGITNPAFPLTVYHATNAAATFQTSGTGTGVGNGFYVGHTSNISYVWNYNNFPLVLATNNTERIRVTEGGNVGIGLTNPSYALHVNGGAASRSDVQVTYNALGTTNTDGAQFGIQSAGAYIWNFENSPIYFGTNNNRRVDIDASGNVGVGTTSPAEKFDVLGKVSINTDGTVNWGNARDYGRLTWDTGKAIVRGESGKALSLGANGTQDYLWIATDGNIGIGLTNPSFLFTVRNSSGATVNIGGGNSNSVPAISIQSDSGSWAGSSNGFAYYYNASDGDLDLYRKNNSTTEAHVMTWERASGNVGIGYTSANQRLVVAGNIAASASNTEGAVWLGSGQAIGLYRDNTYDLVLTQQEASAYPIYVAGAGDVVVSIDSNNNSTSNKFIVGSNAIKPSNELFSVNESGNVYVSNDLNVSGKITAREFHTTFVSASIIYQSGSTQFGNSSDDTHVFTGCIGVGATPRTALTLNQANVSYAGQLQIAASDYAQVTFYNSAALTPGASNRKASLIYNVANSTFEIANQITNGSLILQGSDSGGGKVGIGTDSPISKLDVNGDITGRGSFNGYASSTHNLLIDWSAESQVTTLTATNLFFGTSAQRRMTITSGGNVGIGTSSPAYKLDVNGTGRFAETAYFTDGTFASYGLRVGSVYVTSVNSTNRDFVIANLGTTPGTGAIRFSDSPNYDYDEWAGLEYHRNGRLMLGGPSVFTNNGNPDAVKQLVLAAYSTSDLVITGSNGFVGIGTAGPLSELHVQGTSTEQVLISYNSTKRMLMGRTSDYGWIAPYTSGVSYDNLVLARDGGNVGIGTTSPATKLQVNGTFASNALWTDGSSIAYWGSYSTAYGYLTWDTAYAKVAATGTKTLYLGDDNQVTILDGGNILMGDTVAKPAASASPARLTLRKFTSGNATTVISGSYYLGVGGNEYTANSYRLIGFGYAENNTQTTYPSYIGYQEISTSGYTYGDLVFGTRSTYGATDDPTERMRITYAGNVGIGITSPGNKLSIGSTQDGGIDFLYDGTNNYKNQIKNYWNSGTDTRMDFNIGNSSGVTPTTIMSVGYGGNVGIGTTSPGYKLDVNGQTRIQTINAAASDTDKFLVSDSGVVKYRTGVQAAQDMDIFTQTYALPDTSGTAQWVKLGTWSAAQGGNVITVHVAQHAGFNATTGQNQEIFIFMKTSNGSSVDPNGFAADSSFWTEGLNGAVSAGEVIWEGNAAGVSATAYTLYLNLGAYTYNSQYTVTTKGGSWTNVGTLTSPSGTSSSSTILLSERRFVVNNLLTVDSSNVGIGSTAPAYKLDVAGGIRLDAKSALTDGAYFIGAPSYGFRWNNNADTYNNVIMYDNGNMFVRSSVGIGSTSPASILNTSGANQGITHDDSTTGKGYIRFRNGGTQLSLFGVAGTWEGSSLQDTMIAAETGLGIRFYTNGSGTAKMVVASGGNVGIGTTSPGYKLDVVGNIQSENAKTQTYGSLTGNSGDWFPIFTLQDTDTHGTVLCSVRTFAHSSVTFSAARGYGPSQTHAITIINSQTNANGGYANVTGVRIQQNGSVEIQLSWSSGPTVNIGVQVIGTTSTPTPVSSLATTTDTSGVIDSVTLNNGTVRSRNGFYGGTNVQLINSGVSFLNGGNVGIGITTPSYKLSINGDTGIEGSENYLYFHSSATVGSNARTRMRAVGAGGGSGYGGDLRIDTRASNNAWNENVVTVANTANVGIGTTSPAGKLDVRAGSGGRILFGSYDANYYAAFEGGDQLNFYNGASNATAYINYNGPSAVLIGRNLFVEGNSSGGTTGAVRINSDGNVGIGTTSPAYKLHVQGAGVVSTFRNSSAGANEYTQLEFIAGSRSAYMWLGNQSTTSWAGDGGLNIYTTTGNMDLWTAGAQQMRITSSGNIGIGTMSPVEKLDVNGGIVVRGANYIWGGVTTTLGSWTTRQYSNGAVYTINANGFEINNVGYGSATWFYINSSGNVGIGTTSPAAKLTVHTTGDIAYITMNTTATGDKRVRLQFTQNGNAGMELGTDYSTNNGNNFYFYDRVNGVPFGVFSNTTTYFPGNVGIGSTAPAYKLDVSGTIRATGDVIAYSDARVKENILTLENSLELVKKLRGVSYNKIGETEKKVGVIAQEVLEVLPEVVSQDSEGTYSVAYGNITAVLIEAIKQQQLQIDELKAEIKQLKG